MKRHNEMTFERLAKEKKYESASKMITTPEIICDVFSFLDKDQIERIQLVNQFWNSVIIRHNNILSLRIFEQIAFYYKKIILYVREEELPENRVSYTINSDGTNLSKGNASSWYSQLTVDEVFKNLNDVVSNSIIIYDFDLEDGLDNLLNWIKLVTTKIGGKFRGRYGEYYEGRFGTKLDEIFDNYIIVDKLIIWYSCIREICDNPEIVQWPSTPKEIILTLLQFEENDEVLNFTCNGKLNGANRLTIEFETSKRNYGNFIRQWFELYRTHKNPISLVGKFETIDFELVHSADRVLFSADSVLDAVKTFLNNTQLRVKYSLKTKEFHNFSYGVTNQYVKRSCVLHETDSYALVIEMEYGGVTDMSSINASDLDQPPCNKMKIISFCVKLL